MAQQKPKSINPVAPIKSQDSPPDAPEQDQNMPKPAQIMLRAVHGFITHPYNHKQFNTDTITPVDEIDDWMDCQIKAEKLAVV